MTPPVRTATVTVPATSANLGPGFDSLGLALQLRDEYTATVVPGKGVAVRTVGEAGAELPRDETHLVARSLLLALERLGVPRPGLELTCRNRIPQSRGLGSSAAAIVGGIALAHALSAANAEPDWLEPLLPEIVDLAGEIEGHPDNVAPAALGAFTISWVEGPPPGGSREEGSWSPGAPPVSRAVSVHLHPDVRAVLFIPDATSPTHEARSVLPRLVPMTAAVHNTARSSLLVAALTRRPDLLFPATDDRLHQEQRRGAYPAAMALVDALRAAGVAAVVSGAGPAVLALHTVGEPAGPILDRATPGYRAMPVLVGGGVTATRG